MSEIKGVEIKIFIANEDFEWEKVDKIIKFAEKIAGESEFNFEILNEFDADYRLIKDCGK
ncbi:hypothetical protein CCAL13119_03970 [Campylobacter sp. RM13119]|uniref:hypothetical protein n=1 Tax=Campylobacter TaxID=194 RepID=UPI0014734A9E|nr:MULTISPECIES: hypothetical protein [unclassified Campylobacter]MBE3606120.1 hypothetical protein [Campylobacter sp. RM13119]QKG30018.1 hypothetical protein CDOMF_1789 [Campylobacter sp. RM16187]